MKNKGVIVSILFIICLGVFVTMSTRRFVSGGQSTDTAIESYQKPTAASAKSDSLGSSDGQRTAEDISGGGMPEMAKGRMAAIPEAAGLEGEDLSDAPQVFSADQAVPEDGIAAPQAAVVSEMSEDAPVPPIDGPQTDAAASSKESAVAISPLTGARNSAEHKITIVLNTEEYKKKLKDIDSQIQKMKDSGIEPNTDSYKNMADYEYRLWDTELNTVYQAVLSVMPEETAEELRSEERDWLKERDAAAHKAISKYNGGTIESLEYTASLADSTRTRVYALLENYGSYLDQAGLNISE